MTLTPNTLAVRQDMFGEDTRGIGWRPDVPDFRDHRFSATVAAPGTIDLSRPSLVGKVTSQPVFDQLQTSSCVGNAVALLHAVVRGVSPRSRLQIYYEARRLIGETDRDEGAYIRDAIKVIANLGAGRETWWPFNPTQILADPPEKIDRDALARRVFSYSRLETGVDYQTCLASGFPFVIGISCFDGLFGPQASIGGILNVPLSGERNWGGHAICIYGHEPDFRATAWGKTAAAAGYSVPARAYIARNSWGSNWGRAGSFAIDASFLEHPYLADDAWTIRKVKPPVTA
jgi:hypothetical protein